MSDIVRLTLPDWLVLLVGVGVVVDMVVTVPLVLWMARHWRG